MIPDQNIVGKAQGLFSAQLGEAHQHIVAGILLRLGFSVATSPVRTGAYDLIVTAYPDRKRRPDKGILLRTQCRTISTSLKFTGGTRAGVDRKYLRPSPKEYKYTEKHNDLVIGIDQTNLDLYVVPTRFIHAWGKSISKQRIQALKNNFDILLNWRGAFLKEIFKKLTKTVPI